MKCKFCNQDIITGRGSNELSTFPAFFEFSINNFGDLEVECNQADRYMGTVLEINYCPMCGRRLKKNGN